VVSDVGAGQLHLQIKVLPGAFEEQDHRPHQPGHDRHQRPLVPAADGDAQREGTEVQRETFYLDGIVGDGAATCFDINLVTGPAESHE
jgi:hypothetical protein